MGPYARTPRTQGKRAEGSGRLPQGRAFRGVGGPNPRNTWAPLCCIYSAPSQLTRACAVDAFRAPFRQRLFCCAQGRRERTGWDQRHQKGIESPEIEAR